MSNFRATTTTKIKNNLIFFGLILIIPFCTDNHNKHSIQIKKQTPPPPDSTIITDCNYTFEEAISGTKAPKHILDQLELITVKYYSMDEKIHQGQILTNKQISDDIMKIFDFMLEKKFPVYQAIPIVHYGWNDEKSMEANNTYSFCYRNISYSKHARGMAIDINPVQNPLIWKDGYKHRKNVPAGAIYNPETPGTFTPGHPVVEKFTSLGFKWGYHFRKNFDKHHFEKIR